MTVRQTLTPLLLWNKLISGQGIVRRLFQAREYAVIRIIIGALVGAIPGGIMVFLISGENLALGAVGIFFQIVGMIIGAVIGARKQ